MDIKTLRKKAIKHKTDCLIIGHFEGRGENTLAKELDKVLDGVISRAIRRGDFKGNLNQTSLFYTNGKMSAERILLIGLGNRREFSLERLREVSGTAATAMQKLCADVISIAVEPLLNCALSCNDIGRAITEGALLSLYTFDEYKTEKKEKAKKVRLLNLLLPLGHGGLMDLADGAGRGKKVCGAVYFARDLISRPGNIATPAYLAENAINAAGPLGVKTSVLEREDMEKLGMGALLGVSQGSSQPPKFIILEYSGAGADKRPYVIVGKAVTFDSGGISIKPSANMGEMKTDMSGGAAALGTLLAAASLRLPLNLVALVPATENLPSGSAYKPGDILTSMSGQTIEVLNTDAEGRLILADALTYAERYNPEVVIDIATLTGACIVALGNHATGLMGNNEGLKHRLVKAGEETGERLWELPLWAPYRDQIKSDIADVKNVGGKEAGTITAAAFLERFAGKYPWAHLDIAGTAWESKGRPYIPKGAAGVGVRTLVRFFENEIKA